MSSTPGYSGKSLTAKLGIEPGMRVALRNAPRDLTSWLAPLPEGAQLLGVRATDVAGVMLFVTRRVAFERDLPKALAQVADGGMLWICWPKKASGTDTDVTEQVLRDVALPTGWVDVKVCAVSDEWSGLKFVKRKT